jgi:hypothetical protein
MGQNQEARRTRKEETMNKMNLTRNNKLVLLLKGYLCLAEQIVNIVFKMVAFLEIASKA